MLHKYYALGLLILSLSFSTACDLARQGSQQNPGPISVTSPTATPLVDSPLLAINPTPAPTSRPALLPLTVTEAVLPTLSATFLTAEAEYNETLQASSPTPSPTPSSTPTPFYAVETAPQNAELQRYEGYSIYQETPRFQVIFDPAIWQAIETMLQHQQITDCTLDLFAFPSERRGPMEERQVQWNDTIWRVRSFPSGGMISYSASTKELATFLFGVHYPPTGGSAVETACRAAAEEVLKTFEVVKAATR